LLKRFEYIKDWVEHDLNSLPSKETSEFEYKSSLIKDEELGQKISKAASAFWNSGGGYLILGIDDSGQIDGGISDMVGRTKRTDWIDREISKVDPQGSYKTKAITSSLTDSRIRSGHSVVIIAFEESVNAPHMAQDKKYYIKAGAHSDPATHYLVEAIRAKRQIQIPLIRVILRYSNEKNNVVELAVVVVNDAAALNIELSFDPLPLWFDPIRESFPLQIPLIDQRHEFSTELFMMLVKSQMIGDEPILVTLDYDDTLGNRHQFKQLIDVERNRVPLVIGDNTLTNVENAIKEVAQNIRSLNEIAGAFYNKHFPPNK
jgi:hypothetical protein